MKRGAGPSVDFRAGGYSGAGERKRRRSSQHGVAARESGDTTPRHQSAAVPTHSRQHLINKLTQQNARTTAAHVHSRGSARDAARARVVRMQSPPCARANCPLLILSFASRAGPPRCQRGGPNYTQCTERPPPPLIHAHTAPPRAPRPSTPRVRRCAAAPSSHLCCDTDAPAPPAHRQPGTALRRPASSRGRTARAFPHARPRPT